LQLLLLKALQRLVVADLSPSEEEEGVEVEVRGEADAVLQPLHSHLQRRLRYIPYAVQQEEPVCFGQELHLSALYTQTVPCC
jgi:hypothetical protein